MNNTKVEALNSFFRQHQRVALAFSGGTDSSLLLYAGRKAGCDLKPYFVKSQFQPQFELEDAQRLCKQLDLNLKILPLNALGDPAIAANGAKRCYHCKKRVLKEIIHAAARDRYPLVIDGTNASDDAGDRPGMAALREYAVRSPLAECGFTKTLVREVSKEWGLFTANKSSYACLATRIPLDRPITADLLDKVERAEEQLFRLGFSNFRLRLLDDLARLQLPETQFKRLMQQRKQIMNILKADFAGVLLDLTPRQEEL